MAAVPLACAVLGLALAARATSAVDAEGGRRPESSWGKIEFDGDISRDTAGPDVIRDLIVSVTPP